MSEPQNNDYVRRDLASIPLYIWVLALVVLLLATVACGMWAFYSLRLQQPLPGPSPTPIIWTATPAPTTPTTAVPPTPTTATAPTTVASPDIAIGRYVRVSGTEGVGVSLRQDPDPASTRLAIGDEGDVLIVLDGPRQAGDYTWWLVRDPNDEAQRGWAAANFLLPVEHP